MTEPADLPAAMRARYGFGPFPLPRYRDARCGEWRVVRHLPSLAAGYVSGPRVEADRYVLYRGRVPWMSTSILERESHAFHVSQAVGDVVVVGLGLGMFAYAAGIRPDVQRVIVIEQSHEVLQVMAAATDFERWPERPKVFVIEGDAMAADLPGRVAEILAGGQPDYLYVDIWSACADPEAPRQTGELVARLQPKRAGWWGQELSFGQWCLARRLTPSEPALADYFAEVGVPLEATPGYVRFCVDAIDRHLPRAEESGNIARQARSSWRRWFRLGAG